jgi:hypothetical protein
MQGALPPALLASLTADFNAAMRRTFSESVCQLTDRGMQHLPPLFSMGGVSFNDLGCTGHNNSSVGLYDRTPIPQLRDQCSDTAQH